MNPGSSQADEAREAARALWEGGIKAEIADDPRTPQFANAALSELERLQDGTPGILKDVLNGAEIGATELDVDPMHGLAELVQNADDQFATEISMGIHVRRGKRCLVVVHDGEPVRLQDALAMALAFVSTKRDDPVSKGKFGIGLKTLSRIADTMEVSCYPYHFRIAGSRIERMSRPRSIKGFFDSSSERTLIVLPIKEGSLERAAEEWARSWTPENMLFLQKVKSLRWVKLPELRVVVSHQLAAKETRSALRWRRLGHDVRTRSLVLHDRKQKVDWVRYDAFMPIPRDMRRASKAAGSEATISVAIPDCATENLLYAGLPTRIRIDTPFALSAPFDPNTVRTQIQQNRWNIWLWNRISEFIANLAIHLLAENPDAAWRLIPTRNEAEAETDAWVTDRLLEAYEATRELVRRRGSVKVRGESKRLNRFSYEVTELQGLLQSDDYRLLAGERDALPSDVRDLAGRWQLVLDDLDTASRIDVSDALALFSDGDAPETKRTPSWFLRLTAAALEAGLNEELQGCPCILATDPVAALTPGKLLSKSKLVRTESTETLAYRLGIVRKLDPVYFEPGEDQEKVRAWLEEMRLLATEVNDLAVLNVIAERGETNPLEFSDADLIALRDTLDRVEPELDRELANRVGKAALLDTFEWVGGRKVEGKATIGTCYLPSAIDREPQGWASAAGRTPELTWIASRYATLLNPGRRGAGMSGARRFFSLLGAMTGPRLENKEDNYLHRHIGNNLSVPHLQRAAFEIFDEWPERLLDDYISPDLEKVVNNICSTKKRERRQRGLDLFRTLNRLWLRTYQQTATCTAAYHHYVMRKMGEVPSTWIAYLADQPWLETENGRPSAPRLLDIRNYVTESLYGDARDRFAYGLSDDANRGFTDALGLQGKPSASAAVEHLSELRRIGARPGEAQIRGIYAYLSRLCPPSSTRPEAKVDNLTVAKLRRQFGTNPKNRGLLWIDGQWKTPQAVRLGRAIFGTRRSFVSDVVSTERLWRVLGIREPSIEDCVEVLTEIAADGPLQEEASILTDVYRRIEELVPEASAKELEVLAVVPVSLGDRWTTERPVYVFEAPTARSSLAAKIPLWHPPCSTGGLGNMMNACRLSLITPSQCVVTGVGPADAVRGSQIEDKLREAVVVLQNYLAQHEPEIYQSISVEWRELAGAQLVISENLGLDVSLPDGVTVSSDCNAHLVDDPLTIYLRREDMLFAYDSGGHAVSQCFESVQRRHVVNLAWCSPFAGTGLPGGPAMELARESADDDEDSTTEIGEIAGKKVGAIVASGRRDLQGRSSDLTTQEPVVPRKLKDFDHARIVSVDVANTSATGGKLKPGSKPALKDPGDRGKDIGHGAGNKSAPRGYTDNDREQLALRLLSAVITDRKSRLKDFTRLPLVGADAGDGLKRYFEIKAYSGEMPDNVAIEPSEILRARKAGKDFYLAVIAGLEEGYPTVIKLFAKPLETLDWMKGTSIKLVGVKSKRAVEIRLESQI